MLRRALPLVALAFSAAAFAQIKAAPEPVKPFKGRQVLRVTAKTPMELAALERNCETVWSCHVGVGPVDVQVTPDQRRAIDGMGLPYCVMIEDVQARVDAEAAQIAAAHAQADAAWFQTYRSLAEIHARLDDYAATYPQLATTFIAGQTLEGRDIKGVRLSAPDLPGNPRASRPQVVFDGTQHAREWVSPMTVMYIADSLAEGYAADARAQDALQHYEIIFIPVVNADGYAYTWAAQANRMWRKNRRPNAGGTYGVDPNRNWGYQWGGEGASNQPGNDTYRGTAAFSEPETQVVRDFLAVQPRLRAHIDYHSYSQLVLSAWGYSAELPPDAFVFDHFNPRMVDALRFNGMTYVGGPTYTTIYPASGVVTDWVYGQLGVLSWGIELRDTGQNGFVLPADQIIPTGQENLENVYTFLGLLSEPLYVAPEGEIPGAVESGQSWSVSFNAHSGSGTLANASVYVRNAGTFVPVSTPHVSGNLYTAAMPTVDCGQAVEYYFEATTTDGRSVRSPADAPATVLTTRGEHSDITFNDTMETNTGWTVGEPGDNATTGIWERADPQGTAAQPEDDRTPAGTMCWVTGASSAGGVGGNDVDGGTTTLTSPVFSAIQPPATVLDSADITFWYWYSNNQGGTPNADSMPVLLSTDGGATWTQVADISTNYGAWRQYTIPLLGNFPLTQQMRLRFQARDLGAGSVVEAAIDDVQVVVRSCPRSGDFNNSGGTPDDADIAAFFAAWNSGDASADFNNSGGVPDDADVQAFFEAWNRG